MIDESDIEKLIQMNQRLSLVMGYAMSLLFEYSETLPEFKKDKYYWLIEAVANLIYLDKPLPRMP